MGVDPLSWALLAVAGVATGASIYEGKQATKANKEAVNIQRQQADLQNARQKREAVKQSRLAYATSQAAAANQGVSGSSSAQGGQGSIISQLGDNLSFLDQYGLMTDQAQVQLGKAMSHESNAKTFGAVSDLAMTGVSHASTISSVAQKVFKPK